ncbi:ankyrin repeat domain-containing protein [Candidatus Sororendozoicomonas aggregata]|uniref:ankyrin repeat domain-containing protein n=1 Tax=Candidatus Sororendozoicomonas aggregata TaxID=3073239 RepID=UPI002ED333F9
MRYEALHYAAIYNDVDELKELLAQGDDINILDSSGHKMTPLMIAAINGATAALGYLIKAGADLNFINGFGSTALSLAITSDEEFAIKKAMVMALLNGGANPNIGKRPAIEACAWAGEPEIAAVCLPFGATHLRADDLTYGCDDPHGRVFSNPEKIKKGFKNLLNGPMPLEQLVVKAIRSHVSTKNIPKLPLAPLILETVFGLPPQSDNEQPE